jgi:lysophospholipase L1-like esterase
MSSPPTSPSHVVGASDAQTSAHARRLARAAIALVWIAFSALLLWLVPQVVEGWTLWHEQMGGSVVAAGVPEDGVNGPDPTLGWKHVPGRTMDAVNLGPGITWTINTPGFRADHDFAPAPAPGVRRVIGVGDSFTFGQCAASETWPAQLEARLPATEVINMGANGYGVDQMYLWYQQDGVRFDADVVVLAVIGDDMVRVSLERWPSGYAKPRFRVIDDALVLTNVPVPPRLERGQPLVGWSGMLSFIATRIVHGDPTTVDRVTPLRIVREFADTVHARGDHFLLVYLPQPWGEDWSGALASFTTQQGIPYLDLTSAFLAAQGGQGTELAPRWLGPNAHYNADANALVATELARELTRLSWLGDDAPAPR